MMDDQDFSPTPRASASRVSRRTFVATQVGVGLLMAGAAGPSSAAALPLVESDVTIKTPDGVADAVFLHPAAGAHAGVVIWPDAFGLRPSMRDIGRRLAAEGYAVLVPNPFYRVARAPVFESAAAFDFKKPDDMAKLRPLMSSIGAPGAAERDALAYIAFLDSQPAVDRARKIGTQGYCMGGALVVRTAAAVPTRVGAGCSFHGGGLVTDRPDSPHLLAPKIVARMYFGVAMNDDQKQPGAKDTLRDAFAAARVPARVEVYPARHGWCVPDMPMDDGQPIYSPPDAERAWAVLLETYRAALA